MRTRLELETAPNSAIGTIGRLLAQWELVAKNVDTLVKPTADELILWRLTYNWHQETAEEFEESEVPPTPLIFGKVVLVNSDTLWETGVFPHIIEFNGYGSLIHTLGRIIIRDISDGDLSGEIAKCLRDSTTERKTSSTS